MKYRVCQLEHDNIEEESVRIPVPDRSFFFVTKQQGTDENRDNGGSQVKRNRKSSNGHRVHM